MEKLLRYTDLKRKLVNVHLKTLINVFNLIVDLIEFASNPIHCTLDAWRGALACCVNLLT